MKVLLLGPQRPHLMAYLASFGDEVEHEEAPLNRDSEFLSRTDLMVSFGYRHIIPADVVKQHERRIVNLHISLLPWNRGADPNLWSFLEDTPKGVTIHYVDAGLDTGEIVAQRYVDPLPGDTLHTSYDRLSRAIVELFQEVWPAIRCGAIAAYPQPTGGSSHRLRDRAPYEHYLTAGWDTPVERLIGLALKKER